jgi:hypothetical protein
MATKKNDPAAESTQAQADLAEATVRAEQASMAALEHSAKTLEEVSLDAQFSTGEENPNPNPFGLRPAPGPSYIEYPGKAREES